MFNEYLLSDKFTESRKGGEVIHAGETELVGRTVQSIGSCPGVTGLINNLLPNCQSSSAYSDGTLRK